MRKNCARKWLHFTIDLLPFAIIPIMAIWSINHGKEQLTETVINYKYSSNEVTSVDDLVEGNVYYFNFGYLYSSDIFTSDDSFIYLVLLEDISFDSALETSDYLDTTFISSDTILSFGCYGYLDDITVVNLYHTTDFNSYDYYVSYQTEGCLLEGFNAVYLSHDGSFLSDCITFTDYNEIESVEVNDIGIGSAFYNAIYDTSEKYFNCDNFFNFGAVKQWFNTNFFNGAPPKIMTVILNVIFYEFLTDIMMLIYSFFMFIIDFANECLEKPFHIIER